MAEINNNYKKMPKLGSMGAKGRGRFLPHEKPKNTRNTVKRLLKILLKWRGSLALAVVLTILSALISIAVPMLLGRAIDTFDIKTGAVDAPLLYVILILLAACYLTGWVLDTCNRVIMVKVTQKLVKQVRAQLFAKLQKIPLNFYDTRSHGDTMSRITNDVDNISNTVSSATTHLIASIFTICGTFFMMLYLSWIMTCVVLISIPLFAVLTRTISTRSRDYFLGQQRKLGALNGIIEETIAGQKMVKAFNRQQNVMAEFGRVNGELREYSINAQTWAGFMLPFMNVINNLSFTLIASVGGILSVNGMLSVGLVVSFLYYSRQFGIPLNNIAGMFNNIQSALAGAERVFELLDEEEETPDKEEARQPVEIKGKVEFENVFFSYAQGNPILRNINFSVNPGEVIALVGETGAGKTTIVNLLIRFYEINSGRILIDDIDITDVPKKTLRSCFSVVLQDTFLFTGTIYDNIRYSKPLATNKEVIEAAKLARADEFITRLPKGYDTIVTSSTDNLSLGQRQLIAIARAILCDAPILILDEATSSVDTKTEKDIQHALLALMKSHTSFLIAHRLSTIRDADRIIVIGNGEILESGTQSELMHRKGAYYNMVVSQLGMGEVIH